tara:strand:- start:6361 stop:8727 length:2367 start_codon:yes stop_codon:yes gene_type:complete
MAQEQQYSPVSFDGIVPQLDVGDPSGAFLDSVRFARAGMEQQFEMDLRRRSANQKVKQANEDRYYKELEGLSELSVKAFETFVNYKNQKTKERMSQVWADAFVEGADINEDKLYADYNTDEQAQSETAQVVGEGLSQNLNKMEEPTATDIADATKLRKYTGLEATVAMNARAEAAMSSYGPALSKWLGKVQPEPGAGMGLAINEFNRRWADATGLSQANPGYTAKRIYPTLRREAAAEAEVYTRGFNAAESAKTRDLLTQQLADNEITLDSYFKQVKGLTKSDGKTLMNNDDIWSSLNGKFTTTQLTQMGSETFSVTGKPYSEHPRFQQLMLQSRQKARELYNIQRTEASQLVTTAFNELGPNATKQQLETKRNELLLQGLPLDIVEGALSNARSRSAEATINRQESDRIMRWVNANPGKKIPLSVIGNAPLTVRQQFAGQMEEAAESETVSELIRETQTFKDFSKDFKATVKTIVGVDMKLGSALTGSSDPANFNQFKSEALTDITNRARALMMGDAELTQEQAFAKAKADWIKDATEKQKAKELFDGKTNTFKQGSINQGGIEDLSVQMQKINATKADNLKEGLHESDYMAPPRQGQYSDRVKQLGRRFGLRPKEIVDLARSQQGLPPLQNSPIDDTMAALDTPTAAKIASIENPPVQLGLRAQINSGQNLTGSAQQRTVAVGKQLLEMGYSGIWQHPDFNYDSGYTGTGTERVGSHAPNSYHKYNEALDIGVQANGHQKLEMLYQYLLKNKTRFGIAELFYDPDGSRGHPGDHSSHLHVAFGGGS